MALLDQLEPAAMEAGLDTDSERYMASVAVSLKRIADAMTSPNMYGESGSEAIANSIWRGLQDGYRPS